MYGVNQDGMESDWFLLKLYWLWEHSSEVGFSLGNTSSLWLEPLFCPPFPITKMSLFQKIIGFPSNWNIWHTHWHTPPTIYNRLSLTYCVPNDFFLNKHLPKANTHEECKNPKFKDLPHFFFFQMTPPM